MNASTCQRNCRLVAAGCGVTVAVVLLSAGKAEFLPAAGLGLLVGLILAFALAKMACTGRHRGNLPAEPEAPRAAPHTLDWQVTDGSGGQRQAILGGIAELPSRVPDLPADIPSGSRSEPVSAAPPSAPRARKASGQGPAKPASGAKQPRAAGIDAAMGRTRETAPAEASPLLLLAPREGRADDLKRIVGIGPALERLLNGVGVWHFDQIAAWKAKDIAFVDAKLKRFRGRITRDEWVKQARALARDAGQ